MGVAGRPNKISKDKFNEVVGLIYKKGAPRAADELGVTRPTLSNYVKQFGFTLTTACDVLRRKELTDHFKLGKSVAEVAYDMNVGYDNIIYFCKKYKISTARNRYAKIKWEKNSER